MAVCMASPINGEIKHLQGCERLRAEQSSTFKDNILITSGRGSTFRIYGDIYAQT